MKLDLSKPRCGQGHPGRPRRAVSRRRAGRAYIRVQRGTKSWAIRYTVEGVKRQKTLPLTQPYRVARDLARELRLEAKRGRDVVAERREELSVKRVQERASRERSRRTLDKLIDLYLADAADKLRPATLSEATRFLRKAVVPLHDCDAAELDQRTVAPVLATIAAERGRTSANRAKAYLSCCLTFGVTAGMIDRNQLIGTKKPQNETPRDRTLSEAEIRALWLASDPAADYGAITRLLLLLGQRRDEVGAMRWSELDLDRAMWSISGERTKNKRAHLVPLPAQAVAILVPRGRTEGRDAVFGRSDGDGFAGWSKCKSALDAAVSFGKAWVVHDLRRTAITGMAEIGIAPHIVEAVVNHVSGSKSGVAGVYNRATYLPEKTAALQRWADHVERIVSGEHGANVVAFGR